MDKQTLQDLRGIIEPFLKSNGFELVDLYHKYEGGQMVLGILADRPQGGITIDECGFLNNQISSLMDEKDIIKERYVLEVSSPGMDRTLKTRDDFRRCVGREVIVYLRQSINGKTEIRGIIKEVTDSYLLLNVQDQNLQVPLENISKAKRVIS